MPIIYMVLYCIMLLFGTMHYLALWISKIFLEGKQGYLYGYGHKGENMNIYMVINING